MKLAVVEVSNSAGHVMRAGISPSRTASLYVSVDTTFRALVLIVVLADVRLEIVCGDNPSSDYVPIIFLGPWLLLYNLYTLDRTGVTIQF